MPKKDDRKALEAMLNEARAKLDRGIEIASRRKPTAKEQMEFKVLEDLVRELTVQLGQERLRRTFYVRKKPEAPDSPPRAKLRLVKK